MSTHTHHGVHIPKGPNLFALSVGAVVCFALALIAYAISWMGGQSFIDDMGGNVTFVILMLGLLGSAFVAFMERPKSWNQD